MDRFIERNGKRFYNAYDTLKSSMDRFIVYEEIQGITIVYFKIQYG